MVHLLQHSENKTLMGRKHNTIQSFDCEYLETFISSATLQMSGYERAVYLCSLLLITFRLELSLFLRRRVNTDTISTQITDMNNFWTINEVRPLVEALKAPHSLVVGSFSRHSVPVLSWSTFYSSLFWYAYDTAILRMQICSRRLQSLFVCGPHYCLIKIHATFCSFYRWSLYLIEYFVVQSADKRLDTIHLTNIHEENTKLCVRTTQHTLKLPFVAVLFYNKGSVWSLLNHSLWFLL